MTLDEILKKPIENFIEGDYPENVITDNDEINKFFTLVDKLVSPGENLLIIKINEEWIVQFVMTLENIGQVIKKIQQENKRFNEIDIKGINYTDYIVYIEDPIENVFNRFKKQPLVEGIAVVDGSNKLVGKITKKKLFTRVDELLK